MPLSRLLTHSTWIGLDFSASAAPSSTAPSHFASVSSFFFCALIPSILWIFLSMQGRRRQKFTCKVASCDNDRRKATALGGGMPQKKCQDVAAGWGCMTLCLWCVSECVCVLSVATLARTLCPCRRLSQFVTEVSVGVGDKKLLTWYESKMRRYWWPRQLQTMQSVSLVLFFLFQ